MYGRNLECSVSEKALHWFFVLIKQGYMMNGYDELTYMLVFGLFV